MSIIHDVLAEQIAGLRATAALHVKQRAEALASAEAALVHEAGATARADALQAALDAYTATLDAPPDEPAPDPAP